MTPCFVSRARFNFCSFLRAVSPPDWYVPPSPLNQRQNQQPKPQQHSNRKKKHNMETSLASQPMESVVHPVQRIYREGAQAEAAARLHQLRATQGWTQAAKVCMDQAVFGRSGRMGGLPSSHLLLQHYNNTLTTIDVSDLYGRPEDQPAQQPAPRVFFERQFLGEEVQYTSRKTTTGVSLA